jgi:hypothetical protein
MRHRRRQQGLPAQGPAIWQGKPRSPGILPTHRERPGQPPLNAGYRRQGEGVPACSGRSARSADSVRGCPRDPPSGRRRSRTYDGQRRRDECHFVAFAQVRAVCSGREDRSVKPSASPTQVRTLDLPHQRKRPLSCGNAARRAVFLLSPGIRVCHRGSVRGSGYGYI